MNRYYPKNRIKTGLKTTGNRFLLGEDYYQGEYYQTYDGKFFTGKDPLQPGANQPLTDTQSGGNSEHTITLPAAVEPTLPSLITPVPYYPKPTEQEYKQGYFFRYFLKKRNEAMVAMEISKEIYTLYDTNNPSVNYPLYQATDILWQLTGPLRTTREGRKYPLAGIYDTNKRIVETTDKTFSGLKKYIGEDYTKFSRPG